MSGTVPALPHTNSWRAERDNFTFIINYLDSHTRCWRCELKILKSATVTTGFYI